MASQGPLFPSTATSVTSGDANEVTWTNPGNVTADDGTEAQITAATFDSPDPSFYLYARNFGFTIPAGSTIDGIVVEVDRRSIIASSGIDRELRLSDEAAALIGDDKHDAVTVWPTTLTVKSYGGTTDTWNTGLSNAQLLAMVNDPDFGVYFQAQANIANADIGVDFIRITVYYTAPIEPTAIRRSIGPPHEIRRRRLPFPALNFAGEVITVVFTDEDTVYVDIQASSVELLEAVEAAEIYVDIQTSAVELAEFIDADTVYVDIQTSGVELQENVDVAEVYVDIQTSAVELAEFVDADTVYVDISVETIAEFIDTPTWVKSVMVPAFSALPWLWKRRKLPTPALDPGITPGVITTDSDTVYVDIQVTSVEFAEFVDSAEIYVDVQLSSVELAEFVDADTVYVDVQTTSVELAEYVDAAEIYVDIQLSAVEFADFVDASEVYVDIQLTSVDVAEFADADTTYVDIQPSSMEVFEAVDAAEVYVDIQVGFEEFYVTGEPTFIQQPPLFALGKLPQMLKRRRRALLAADPGAVAAIVSVDAATVYMDIQVTSAELAEFVDAQEVYVDIQLTSDETAQYVDSAVVPFDLEAGGSELAEFIESALVYLDLQVSAVEVIELADAALVMVTLTPSSLDVAEYVDGVVIGILLTPSGVEESGVSDAAVVYVDIQPSSTGLIVDTLLQIVGYTTRWLVVAVVARWAILETRRFTWKS